MSSNPKSIKSIQTSNEVQLFDASLKELVAEAKTLSSVMDAVSSKIRELEACLKELKAHFPFRYKIFEEKANHKPVEEHHRASYPVVLGYSTQVYWYLAWEEEDISKNYRLCLVSEEKGIIAYNIEDDRVYWDEVLSKIMFKKPLIETDLSTRLRYANHLLSFIDSFKAHIISSRIGIQEGMTW